MKKAYILLTTTFVIFFIILSIGSFIKYSTTITSQEFHKDLAKIRGYWAVYGAKELNSSIGYSYYRLGSSDFLYDINATKVNATDYNWSITNSSKSGIKDNMIFKRVLTIGTDSNATMSYKK